MVGKLYFYLLSAIGIVLIIIGVFSVTTYFVNTSQYEEYPLSYAQDCAQLKVNYSSPVYPTPSKEEIKTTEDRKKAEVAACEKRLVTDRKKQKINDMKNAILFPIIGVIVFLFHFPIARRLSHKDESK